MGIEQANSLLGQFGEVIGLAELALDERGYACLTFDDLAVSLEYEPNRDALALFTWLGEAERSRCPVPGSSVKSAIQARLATDPQDASARKDALAHLLANGGDGLQAQLTAALDAARTATPKFADSGLAQDMHLTATSSLVRFGALSGRLAELHGG